MKCKIRCVFLIIVFLLLGIFLVWPTDRIIASWDEPMDDDADTQYELSIIEGGRYIEPLIFSRQMMLMINVKQDRNRRYTIPVDIGYAEYDACETSCSVKWGMDGVTFSRQGGYDIFIPKSSYQ